MIRSSLALAALVLVAFPTVAGAEDFTFDVPVHVSNMPRLTQGYVQCFVSAVPVGGSGRAATENVIGRAQTFFRFTATGYDGTVTVAFNNTSRRPSSDARSYTCSLFGGVTNDSGSEISLYAETWRYDYPPIAHVPVERETSRIDGNLP